MHVALQLPDGQMIMASDMIAGMGPQRVEGTNYSISVHPDSRQDADRIFKALGEGGKGHNADRGPVLGGLFRQPDRPLWDQLDGELHRPHQTPAVT
jgi:hypothetical protein